MPANNPDLPTLPEVLNGFRVFVRGALFGQLTLNHFDYVCETPDIAEQSRSDFALAFWETVRVAWLAAVSQDWTANAIFVARLETYAAPYLPVPISMVGGDPWIGERPDSCPPQDAVCIKKLTEGGGKKQRGRSYIAGVSEDDHNGGLLIGAAQVRFEALGAALLDAVTLGANTYEPYFCKVVDTPPADHTLLGRPLDNTSVDSVIRTQRRRQIGRGV